MLSLQGFPTQRIFQLCLAAILLCLRAGSRLAPRPEAGVRSSDRSRAAGHLLDGGRQPAHRRVGGPRFDERSHSDRLMRCGIIIWLNMTSAGSYAAPPSMRATVEEVTVVGEDE